MRIRRHCQLDLTVGRKLPVARQQSTQQLADQFQQRPAMLRGVVAFVLDQQFGAQIGALDGLAEPREVIPDAEVAK
jgi:hypothetical protein